MTIEATLRHLFETAGVGFKENGKSFILSCPRCRKPKKLYFRKVDARFACWVCKELDGFSGAGEWGLREVVGLPIDELQKLLYGTTKKDGPVFLDVGLDQFFDSADDFLPFEAPPPEVEPDPGFRPLDTEFGTPGAEYLARRGVPVDVAQQYGICYHPAHQRVIFPVHIQGKLVGWQGRYIGETEFFDEKTGALVSVPKVLSTAGLKRDEVLMFADRAKGDHVVLCEGPMDALKCHLVGGNVASMGKAVSNKQLQLIRNSGAKKLYLALDPDAFQESARILREICSELDVYNLWPTFGHKDLGEMSMEDVKTAFDAAPKLSPAHLFVYLKDPYVR